MVKKKKEIEIIRLKSSDKKCYICDGTGCNEKENICSTCDGTGIFVDSHYILIATDNNGNKIAFDMDTIK